MTCFDASAAADIEDVGAGLAAMIRSTRSLSNPERFNVQIFLQVWPVGRWDGRCHHG